MSPQAPERPTVGEMLGEVIDLSAGLGVVLLPLLLTAIPGVILFLLLPGLLIVAAVVLPVVLTAAAIAPPYLLVRAARRRRRVRRSRGSP